MHNQNQHLFEKLVKAYSSDLFRFAFWLSKDRNVAEDLVQETFTRAWKSIESLKDESAAKAWLMTILRRENARRFEKKQPVWVNIEEAIIAGNSSNEPENTLEKTNLYKAIMNLELEFREPLIMQVIWGYSSKEIAEQLDLKVATINTRLFRARNVLKKSLGEKKSLSTRRGDSL